MRFLDTNVVLYAILETKRELSKSELAIKSASKEIMTRINTREDVLTTSSHVSEIANILESRQSRDFAREFLETFLLTERIRVFPVGRPSYLAAIELSKEYAIGINDCVAVIAMMQHGIREIYSFASDFDGIGGIKRVFE